MADPQPEFEREALRSAVKGNRLEQLEAMRDYIAEQLEVNMCTSCRAAKLNQGAQASLIQKLREILDEVEALTASKSSENRLNGLRGVDSGVVVDFDPTRQRRSVTGDRRPGGGRRSGVS